MELDLTDKLFVVTGATSGFGKAIALSLLSEGAKLIINARGKDRLDAFQSLYPDHVTCIDGDISTDATISRLIRLIGNQQLHGVVINAGGPPARSFLNTAMQDWDDAYRTVLRWKVKLTQNLIPLMKPHKHGRLIYIESASVKQPIDNLVLSNSLRLAVVGFVKTLSREIATSGITANIIAPGYHGTPAMNRLYTAKSTALGISVEDAQAVFTSQTAIGTLGDPDDLASLATWILSDKSSYITGQTFTIDGGLVSNVL